VLSTAVTKAEWLDSPAKPTILIWYASSLGMN